MLDRNQDPGARYAHFNGIISDCRLSVDRRRYVSPQTQNS